jgi:hypothetical protein
MLHLPLRTEAQDASLLDILDRILDKGIVFEPLVRIMLSETNFQTRDHRIVIAPERRNKPFIVPTRIYSFRAR